MFIDRREHRMKRLLVMLCIAATMGFTAPAAGAAEIIHEETSFSVSDPTCFDERIEATGTATIVQSDVASVVTLVSTTAED